MNDTDELFQSGILSSILVVDLATSLEDEFNISIPFTEITLEISVPPKETDKKALLESYLSGN